MAKCRDEAAFNPLMGTGNYSATSNNMKLVHWPLMGGLLHLVQRGGTGRGRSPPRPLLVVPNVTAHPSTASVPITVLLCNGPLICGFNVPVKALRHKRLPFHVCQVVTVVVETAQLVLNNFQTFNVVN